MGRNKQFTGKKHYTTIPDPLFKHLQTQANSGSLYVTQYLNQLIIGDMKSKGTYDPSIHPAVGVEISSTQAGYRPTGADQTTKGDDGTLYDEDGSVLF